MNKTSYSGLYIDTETGGLDPQVHALTSICAAHFRLFADPAQEIEIEAIYLPIKPSPALVVSASALQVQNKTLSELQKEGIYERDQLLELSHWLLHEGELHTLSIWAHNADFDRGFLTASIRRCKANATYAGMLAGRDARWNCTRYLAEYLVQKGKLELPRKADGTASVSLDPLMERLGIPGRQGSGHDAREDVGLGVRVLDALLRLDGWWK